MISDSTLFATLRENNSYLQNSSAQWQYLGGCESLVGFIAKS
ncbi:MAG: hypothetical protein ACOCWB_00915 [Bacteroidota bacterium]